MKPISLLSLAIVLLLTSSACNNASDPDINCPNSADCGGRDCGPHPLCGISCGDCAAGYACDEETGQCVLDTCVSDCQGRDCGSDGCDGSCGDCTDGYACDEESGQCVLDHVLSCVLTEPAHMVLVHVGDKADCQDELVAEGIDFLERHSSLQLSWEEASHPFVMPPERWGGIFVMPWDVDEDILPDGALVTTTLWECDREDPDLDVWAAGGAMGADHGVKGAAIASMPTHGCGVWWVCAGAEHGFQEWGAQILVHEIRNAIDWWYTTDCVAQGSPELLNPYDTLEDGTAYCAQFLDLHECYTVWFEDMRRGLTGVEPRFPRP